MQTQKTPPRITLTPSKRLRLPPRADTIVELRRASTAQRAMCPTKPATVFIPDDSERDRLKARVQELEAEAAQARQQAAAAQQLLHNHASQVWLEEEARLRMETMQRRAERQSHRDNSRVCDNTLPDLAPQVIATTDAVHLKLPLNPRTAIPMALPWLSVMRNWLRLKW